MITAETERFILRPFETQDIDFLNELHSDEQVVRYTLGRTLTHDENLAYLQRLLDIEEEHGIGQRIVIRKQDGQPVGRCGLSFFYGTEEEGLTSYHFDPHNVTEGKEVTRVIELGYSFLQKYWRRGYASEAAAAMRDHGLKIQAFGQLHSIIRKENIGSLAVAEKIGAIRLQDCLCNGQPGWDYVSRL